MKLNDQPSNLADPLLLTGCQLGNPPWSSGGPFNNDLISTTTTFPDDTLILPPTPSSGGSSNSSCKSSPPGHNSNSNSVELDALLIVHSGDSFAELKPLPPFEYPGNVQLTLQNDPHLPQMGTNNSGGSNSGNNQQNGHNGNGTQNNSNAANNNSNIRNNISPGNFPGNSPNSLFEAVSSSTSTPLPIPLPANIKSELADYLMNSDIDDIAALIGNAIADSTVPNLGLELDPNGVTSSTVDPWTELDAWIETACQQTPGLAQLIAGNGSNASNPNGVVLNGSHPPSSQGPRGPSGAVQNQDATIHTSANDHFLDGGTSTLQTLLEADPFSSNGNGMSFHAPPEIKQEPGSFHSSILQSRLQQPLSGQLLRVPHGNGGPNTSPTQLPESTSHHGHPHSSHPHYGLKVDPYTLDPGSPTYMDPMTGEVTQRPHTTHVSPPAVVTSTMMSNGPSKYRKQYKMSNGNNKGMGGPFLSDGGNYIPFGASSPFDNHHHGLGNQQSKLGMKKRKSSKLPTSSVSMELDPLGKEKPIHRCGICNRGFLNKSNIKVHLRTHTGEKPFKCDVCGKAFRQKAHLLKHVQIHKRIQRD